MRLLGFREKSHIEGIERTKKLDVDIEKIFVSEKNPI